jgi:DNA-binding CsgD family transcriptional regulator
MSAIPFIGRREERERINQFFEVLREEGSRCLLMVGEVGIGKTTLLNWARKDASHRGFRVLSASPVESEVPLEFAALADLLGDVPRSIIDELPVPQKRALGVAVFRDELPEEPIDPRTLAAAALGTLRHLAASTPVLLAIDDLPWLDTPSARVLSYVLRRAGDSPFGLVGTVRIEWSGERSPLITDPIGADRVERIRVGPMNEQDISQMLTDRTGLNLGRNRLKHLLEVSRGNPLFALELTETNADPKGSVETMEAPRSLRRLMKGRIGQLPPGSRDVLLVAALNVESTLAVIVAAAADPTHAAESLERVVEAGIIVRTGAGIAFAHPLIRSIVVEDATAEHRRTAHRRLAGWVTHPEERARHLALGADGPNEEIAQELERAAQSAAGRGACDTAAALAEIAVSLTPSGRLDDRNRRATFEAENRFEASDPNRAIALLEAVVESMAWGPDRAEVLRRLARYLTYRGDPITTWTARLTAALEEARDDPVLRCAIATDLGVAAANAGDPATATSYSDLALELADRTGDAAREAQLLAGMAFLAFCNGDGVRQDLIERALSGPEQPLRLGMELRPRFAIGTVLHWSDDLDGARDLFEQEQTRAFADGVETGLPQLRWGQAETEAWAGNWERAEELATDGYLLAEDSGLSLMMGFVLGVRTLVHVYRGRLDEGRRDGERAVEIGMSMGSPLIALIGVQALGLAELSVGDAATAHQRLAPLADMVRATGVAEPGILRFLPDEVEALTRLGELDAAVELLDPFEARSIQLGRKWGMATSARCRGLLLAARGDLDSAIVTLDLALQHHAALGMPFEQARTLLTAGEIHRRARHKSVANTHLSAALTVFERLGAPLWAQRTRAEIDRIGMRRTTPGSKLKPIETRVADLAAVGLTNGQIGNQLFMSPRTVEAHLSRIYRKLGVNSRTAMTRVHLSGPAEET